MKNPRFLLFTAQLLVFVSLISLFPTGSAARDYLDLSADVRKLPTAVPYFIDKTTGNTSESGRKFASLLSRSLEFHGFLTVIDPQMYGGRQDMDWRTLGAELAVLGQYEKKGDNLVLEMRLLDILNGQMIVGKRYRGSQKDHKLMLFKFCDEAIYKLTGEQGIALSQITFVSNNGGSKEIYIADILGDQVRQVTRHHDISVSPKFTPDGRDLAYTSYHRGNPNLYLTQLSGSTTRAISWRPGLNLAPAFSPINATMILSLSMDGNSDLYLAETNAKPRQQVKIIEQLTKNSGLNVSPCWSPDGKKIAFVSDRGGSPQIYVMDMKNRNPRRITFLGNYNTSPSWSPKGDSIAYAGFAGGVYQIFTISPDGGEPKQITNSWGSHESPSWSPDGRQIVFSRQRNNDEEICAIFRNGSGLRPLFHLPGDQSLPQWSPRLPY